jgi:methionine sulfoxide reductase catalytic subunit
VADDLEITPWHLYMSRRRFLAASATFAGAALLGGCGPFGSEGGAGGEEGSGEAAPTDARTDELGARLTSFDDITSYNNFYEFHVDKETVAELAADYSFTPWTVQVDGLVANPKRYSIEEIYERFADEERIYRLRCVEGWSMVIPWLGFPLGRLLEEVEPTPQAQYVRFEAVLDRENLPGQARYRFSWPYVEGLRLDEAMHDLTILSTGLYGRRLLPQNGAPLRLVVPWKYGFKSIKSIVRIELVEQMPVSFWMDSAPREYGFYANVNPQVDHPRWSQASERRIGELRRRDTLLFNGYEEQVAHLYAGLDLEENF